MIGQRAAGKAEQRQAASPLRAAGLRVATSPMLRILGRRLLIAIPVLWGVTFLTFSLMNLLPGDAAVQLLGQGATQQQIHNLQIALHLNQSFPVRYWGWLSGLLQGNLGSSLTDNEPVTVVIGGHLAVTLELVIISLILALVFAIPVAVIASLKPGGLLDKLTTTVTVLGFAVPNFVFALVLIIVFAVETHVLPAVGYVPLGQSVGRNLRSMVLPSVSLASILFCLYVRLLRGDIVDQLQSQDYVVTARAKGAPRTRIIVRHVLRNSLLGLITVVGVNLGGLIGGTVIIEQIFGLGGIGSLLLNSINVRDVPVVEAIVLIVAVVVVFANLGVDLLYTVLDPRIRHERSSN